MTSDTWKQTSRRSPARARMVVSPASTWGHGGGLAGATKLSVRGGYGKDIWVPSGGMAPLSWCFGQVGLGVDELCIFELVGAGEEHRW